MRASAARNDNDFATRRLARNLQSVSDSMRSILVVCMLLMAASTVRADGQILVSEVLPSLEGTELGAVPIADAPLPGTSMLVRRSDVLRALTQAGFSGRDLSIPRATRISREVVTLSKETLLGEAQAALADAAVPCVLQSARVSADTKVVAGPRAISVELPKRSNAPQATALHVTGAIYVESGGQRVRVPVMANLTCPPPEVNTGAQVTVVAVIGNVRASAPAEARQPGRVGEIIRVTNRATGAALRARVIDSLTCEVVP